MKSKMNIKIAAILGFVCIAMLVSGCGYNPSECKQVVSDRYPDADVKAVTGSDYKYVVKMPDGTIREVQVMNITNTEVTLDVPLFD